MGNVLEICPPSSTTSIEGAVARQEWSVALDCRPGRLRPLLVSHQHQLILQPNQVNELVKLGQIPQIKKLQYDVYGELPLTLMTRAARLRASKLLAREVLSVPRDHDSTGIESVPVSSSMLLFGSIFGRVLIEFMCRSRRVQLDLVAQRARKSIRSHPTTPSRELLRQDIITKGMGIVPGERGSSKDVMAALQSIRAIAERDLLTQPDTLLSMKAIAGCLEVLPYGLLADTFVVATSAIRTSNSQSEDESALCLFLGTYWSHLKKLTSYEGALLLHRCDQLEDTLHLLLTLCAVTASFEIFTHTIVVLMLTSCASKLNDIYLSWKSINTLNCIRACNDITASDIEVVSPEGQPFSTTQACIDLIDILEALTHNSEDFSQYEFLPAAVSIDSSSLICFLDFVRRIFFCFFARVKHEDASIDSFATAQDERLRTVMVPLHEQGSLFERIQATRTLQKIVKLITDHPENSKCRRLDTSVSSVASILKLPCMKSILHEIGFKAQEGHDEMWEADEISQQSLLAIRCELDRFMQMSWSSLLPKLLKNLHFHVRVLSNFQAFPSNLDAKESFGSKYERLSDVFNDLIRSISFGFDSFQPSDNKIRIKCARLSIRVVCDGIRVFLPKSSQQVSFLSRLFDTSYPFTPSSSIREEMPMPQPARNELADYLFLRSSIATDSNFLTDLAFGQDDDSWSRLVLDIWNESRKEIAWKRVCRVISDMQMNDIDFERYKNDPVMSPILNKLTRASESDVAPLKMGLINEALIVQASVYPKLLNQIAAKRNMDKIKIARSAAIILFSLQRNLFNRAIADGSQADKSSNHPTLEFSHLLIRHTIDLVTTILDRQQDESTLSIEQCVKLRKTVVGAFLPHVLLGISATMSLYHSGNKTLLEMFHNLHKLKSLLGDYNNLNDFPLREICEGSRCDVDEYSYEQLETLLDGGNIIEDVFIDPVFNLDVEDSQTKRNEAKKHFEGLMDKYHCVSSLRKDFEDNYLSVLEDLSRAQSNPRLLWDVTKFNVLLRRIVYFIAFGEEAIVPHHIGCAMTLELPSLQMCSLCGLSFSSVANLIDHSIAFEPTDKDDVDVEKPTLCNNIVSWLTFIRHLIVWTIAKISRRFITGDTSSVNTMLAKTPGSVTMDVDKQPKEQQWLSSPLFKGGLESSTDDINSDLRVVSAVPEETRFLTDLISGNGEAGFLDTSILKLPQFRIFPHRLSGGVEMAQATRAIVAALVKHTGNFSLVRTMATEISAQENAAQTLLIDGRGHHLQKLWAHADSLKGHWVFLHQEGILNVCSKQGCTQSVSYSNDIYLCGNGHEFEECNTLESLSYAEIARGVLEKCRLLMDLHPANFLPLQPSFLRRTSTKVRRLLRKKSVELDAAAHSQCESPNSRQKWKIIRNALFSFRPQLRRMKTPSFCRTINEAVLAFIRDADVDIHLLRDSLQNTISAAQLRTSGLDAFATLFKRVPISLRSSIVIELVSSIRDWPTPPGQIAHHYHHSIESAGTAMLGNVKNSFAVVAGFVASFMRDTVDAIKTAIPAVSNAQCIEFLHLLDFWKLGFVSEDFTLLRSINLAGILRRAGQTHSMIGLSCFTLFNAIGLLSFCSSDDTSSVPFLRSLPADTFQVMLVDSMLEELSIEWPQRPKAIEQHEVRIFETFSTVLMSCKASKEPSKNVCLHLLRKSEAWTKLLCRYFKFVLEPESSAFTLSPRIMRRVSSICAVVFSTMEPPAVSSIFFDCEVKSAAIIDRFISASLRCIGFFTCWSGLDTTVYKASAKLGNVHRRCALRFLRELHDNTLWEPFISRTVSSRLSAMSSYVHDIRTSGTSSLWRSSSHTDTPLQLPSDLLESIVHAVGSCKFIGNYTDFIHRSSRVLVRTAFGTLTHRRKFKSLSSKVQSGLGTVVDLHATDALVVLDSDVSLSPTPFDIMELEAVSESLQMSGVYLTCTAVQALLSLVSLMPCGSPDRRKSSVERRCDRVGGPTLLLAQLQTFGMQAFLAMLQAPTTTTLLHDTLASISTSPSFMQNILRVARTPIPLFEAAEMSNLESACHRLAMFIHDHKHWTSPTIESSALDLHRSSGEHIEWCRKAVTLCHDSNNDAVKWLQKRHEIIKAALSPSKTLANDVSDDESSETDEKSRMIKRLRSLGFPLEVCEKALEESQYIESVAANWLMDNGARETNALRLARAEKQSSSHTKLPSTFVKEEWGKEGTDFFQEMGDGSVSRDIVSLSNGHRQGNFEAFSDQYNRMALQTSLLYQKESISGGALKNREDIVQCNYTLPITKDDIHIGQHVTISPSWVHKTARIGEEFRGAHKWYLNSIQNTWESFDENVTSQLEKRWRMGDTFCTAILDSEPFMFRLDRMAMYHCLTGFMVRLRRRYVEKKKKSPFHLVENDAMNATAIDDNALLDPEQRLQLLLDDLTPLQKHMVDQVHAVVSDFPRSWAFHALAKNNFDPNLSVEWLFANSPMLAEQDQENERTRVRMLEQNQEKQEASSRGDRSMNVDEDLSHVMLLSGETGVITHIDECLAKVRVRFDNLDNGVSTTRSVPLAALEYPDHWIEQEFPEIAQRKPLGIKGLTLDSFVALGIITARRSVLSILQLSLANIPSSIYTDETAMKTDEHRLVSLSRLNLKVSDVISILKLVANDSYELDTTQVGIWPLLHALAHHPKYAEEVVPFLIDDCLVHLRQASTRSCESQSRHPYADNTHVKKEMCISDAKNLMVEFDRRCHLKEGHAILSFWSDPECTKEIAVMSGSGVGSSQDPSGSGFRPLLIHGNRFWIKFGSGSSRPNKYEFGYSLRVRPLGYRYEDEREILKAPLGWSLLSLLASKEMIPLEKPQSLINACIHHPRIPQLFQALIRYLLCENSPAKVFVTNSVTKLLVHLKTQSTQLQEKILKHLGGNNVFFPLQTTRNRIREVNARATIGSHFSPFLKAIVNCVRIARTVYPSISFQDTEFATKNCIEDPWNIKVPIGKCSCVTVARVEQCLLAISGRGKAPSLKIYELAYEHLNNMQLLRLCLKELETSIKIAKQHLKWKDERHFWMTMVNSFKDIGYLADILLMLRRSMLDSAFEPMWALRHKEWEDNLRQSKSISAYAMCLLDLEKALKWRDEKDDNRDSALVISWRSTRENWLKTVRTLSEEELLNKVLASIPSPSKASTVTWTSTRNEQFVAYVDALIVQNARRLRSLHFVDIVEPRRSDIDKKYSSLRGISLPHLRSRFAVLKMLNQLASAIITSSTNLWCMESWSLGTLLRESKHLFFLEAKMGILTQNLQRLYSKEKDPQSVILNRHEATKQRENSRVRHSLFGQLYSQLRLVNAQTLRRKGQAWRVKFVGERGHDVGGLFSASLSNICDELMSERLPLFIPTPNSKHHIGENREKFVPNPLSNGRQHLAWFEFVGRLMGIACLSLSRTLSLDIPSIVWKSIVREPLILNDLKMIDFAAWRIIQLMRQPDIEKVTEASFEYIFPELFFTCESSDQSGREIELCSAGASKRVTWQNRKEYACLVEEYRLHEVEVQIGAICSGIAQLVPLDLLSLFSWQQMEVLVCGNPNIDISLLREKTIYGGNVRESDRHIQMFWEVIELFSTTDRRTFLQFVWGRSRLPATKVGFGKDAFKITDHMAALEKAHHSILSYNSQDMYLPVAHTCFFALELPRYSHKDIMREKILFAVHNCKTIDGDTTEESRRNQDMSWSDGETDDDDDGANDDDEKKSA